MPDAYLWYQALQKPPWAPPSWLFGPVWTVLYSIIIITFGLVFYRVIQGKMPTIIALAIPGGWVTLIGPIFITYLICFVSGVPMLEKKYASRADWEEYKKKTSVLVPIPRRTLEQYSVQN